MTRTETRYGCFLSDLTGLARSPSIANLPRHISAFTPQEAREAMKMVGFSVSENAGDVRGPVAAVSPCRTGRASLPIS